MMNNIPKSSSPPGPASATRMLTFFTFVVVTVCLYFSKAVLLPVAMAILISFLLTPVSTWLEKRKVPRAVAVVTLVGILFCFTASIGYVVVNQFVDFVDKLPNYKNNIIMKAKFFKPKKDNLWVRMQSTLGEVQKEVTEADDQTTEADTQTTGATDQAVPATRLMTSPDFILDDNIEQKKDQDKNDGILSSVMSDTPVPESKNDGAPNDEKQAVPVRIVATDNGTMKMFSTMVAPIVDVVATIGLIGLLVIFILMQREDLRDRFMKLVGNNSIRTTTEALGEAASRVSRYLGMQLIVNATYGVVLGVGLIVLGLPNAFLWGVLAILLRFVPYIGPWIAAAMPVALSLAVFDNWMTPMLVVGLFVILELLSNNLMEPILYGQSTGISPVAIIISAIFWAWIWGPMGLILATPITVCLVVMGRHIPQLAMFSIMLGDEPPLSDDARVYNRLLSGTVDDALDISEEYLEKNSFIELCDEVFVPAMEAAETDRNAEQLSQEKYEQIIKNMKVLINSLAEMEEQEKLEAEEIESDGTVVPRIIKKVAIVPVQDASDHIVGIMLKQCVKRADYEIKVLPTDRLVSELLSDLKEFKPDTIVVSALPPVTVANTRYLCKRLRMVFPDSKILVGCWNSQPEDCSNLNRRVGGDYQDGFYRSIQDIKNRL